MTRDRGDRTLASDKAVATVATGEEAGWMDSRHITGMGPAVALMRSLLVVFLAALAILVLLPAAIAAQAASAV
jgi:hypothetical protein